MGSVPCEFEQDWIRFRFPLSVVVVLSSKIPPYKLPPEQLK